ncbi:MAG: hypothetical protein HKN75_11095 [Bacteroidia bacterium]|nr:hypothetical protein [Bacteroidia bacterium]
MKILSLFLFLSIALGSTSYAQDVYDKIAKQTCKCFEKEKIPKTEDAGFCMIKYIAKNIKGLKAFHGLEKEDKLDLQEVSIRLSGKYTKQCAYYNNLLIEESKSKIKVYEEDLDVVCPNDLSGNYYYLTPTAGDGDPVKTYVTIEDGVYTELLNEGKTYSKLDLKIIDDCTYQLIFDESDDPGKDSMSKKGDTYTYRIIQNSEYSFVVITKIAFTEFYVEYVRTK